MALASPMPFICFTEKSTCVNVCRLFIRLFIFNKNIEYLFSPAHTNTHSVIPIVNPWNNPRQPPKPERGSAAIWSVSDGHKSVGGYATHTQWVCELTLCPSCISCLAERKRGARSEKRWYSRWNRVENTLCFRRVSCWKFQQSWISTSQSFIFNTFQGMPFNRNFGTVTHFQQTFSLSKHTVSAIAPYKKISLPAL